MSLRRAILVGVAAVLTMVVVPRWPGRATVTAQTASTASTDWPQWRGPERSGLSKETGLLKQWPASGPSLLWSIAGLGAGYGSLSVSGDQIYVQGSRNGQSVVTALSKTDGRTVWSKP